MNKLSILTAAVVIFFIAKTNDLVAIHIGEQHNELKSNERLFPLSCYGQAVEICMRVVSDHKHYYDNETAADLCVGRLCRLARAVEQMEDKHMTQQRYCSEDIVYILGLMGVVYKEQAEALASSVMASSLFSSIESRLALLLRFP
jgi:hypothetical protein